MRQQKKAMHYSNNIWGAATRQMLVIGPGPCELLQN